jgi:hypothetical protein
MHRILRFWAKKSHPGCLRKHKAGKLIASPPFIHVGKLNGDPSGRPQDEESLMPSGDCLDLLRLTSVHHSIITENRRADWTTLQQPPRIIIA